MKFNIVKIMVGTDKLLDEDTLYKHCHDSVLKEFPDDNIIIFHSFEEIERKYNIPHFEGKNLCFSSDYYRIQLAKYIDNYLYLDQDIMIFPGFRNELIRLAENNNSIFGCAGYSLIYSKNKNNLSEAVEWLLNNRNIGYIADYILTENYELKTKIEKFYWHFYNHNYFSHCRNKIIITNDKKLEKIKIKDNDLTILTISDYGYQFNTDGHCFVPEDQLDFVLKYYFTNPNKVVLDLRY